MEDLQEQLKLLRERIARVNERMAAKTFAPPPQQERLLPPEYKPVRYHVDEWQSGQEVATPFGRHWETERLYEAHRRHGSAEIGALVDLPHDLLQAVSQGEAHACCPTRWAFLDTETTGLAGGTGTYAFLVGIGRITRQGFYIRHFFMREHGEEASMLHSLTEHLREFDLLVTYNGKAYDQPLLETRYRLQRARPPFGRLPHVDLLAGARRLWKLRVDSCRLVNLETQILGVERIGDLPGELIPYVYFEYLRKREIDRLLPVFHHNAIDILSLGCLAGVIPWVFHAPDQARFTHGADMVGVARWLRNCGRELDALSLFRRAIDTGLRDDLLWKVLWERGLLEKKLGQLECAQRTFSELSTCRNPHQVEALEELAKHHEHATKDLAEALRCTQRALECVHEPGRVADFKHRAARLEKRLARQARALPVGRG